MVQKLVIVTFSLRSPLLGVVYKPAVASGEFAGVLVLLYHILLVGRVSQEEKRVLLLLPFSHSPQLILCMS